MTITQEIRQRRLDRHARINSKPNFELKEIRKKLAIVERDYPGSALHKGLLELLELTKNELKSIKANAS